jgi:hypothetical protein
MVNELEKKYEHVFYFCIWGSKYIDQFSKYTCNSLLLNLKKINNKKNLIYIWTTKNDLKYLKKKKIIKELSKTINIKYFEFDYIKANNYSNTNKYTFLSILQSLFIGTFSFNTKYIWFLYPDFIFSENSLNFMINKLKKNKKLDSILLPVPQVNFEKLEEIYEKNGYNYISIKLPEIIIDNLHKIVKIFDVRNTQLNTISVCCIHEKEYLIMNNFHLHPVVIKTDVGNYNYFDSVFPSLDEGYTRILKNKLTYIPKSSDEVAFLSMLEEDEIKFPKLEFNLNQSIDWCEAHVNKFQIQNLDNNFLFYKKKTKLNNLQFNKNLLNKFKKRLTDRLKLSDKELFKKKFHTQLIARYTSTNIINNTIKILNTKNNYLKLIFKNQFYKIFKKKISKIILDIYDKEKTKESSLVYKLYLDSLNLNKIKLKK